MDLGEFQLDHPSPEVASSVRGAGTTAAQRDVDALGIATAAIILFVGTGGSVLPQVARSWFGVGHAPDTLLVNALLLNVALMIFGWRRYQELTREVGERRKAPCQPTGWCRPW